MQISIYHFLYFQNATTVSSYFPKGLWYTEKGKKVKSLGEKITLDIPIEEILLSFRGGSIIPAKVLDPFSQNASLTTTLL